MRRSHRLALSAGVALAALVVAGRLATRVVACEDAARDPAAAQRAGGETREAVARSAWRTSREGSVAAEVAADEVRPGNGAVRPEARNHARDAEARISAGAPVALDDPQLALGAALAVAGRDSAAPREIDLWRIAGARAVRVAIGASRADGSLDLPALVLPAGEVTLVASPHGEGADSRNASAPVVVSRDPSAPALIALEAGSAETALIVTVEPAEQGGSVVVARGNPEEIGQEEIGRAAVFAGGADAAPLWLAIAVALGPDDTEILVAQEVSDGRRSPWRRVAIVREPQGD